MPVQPLRWHSETGCYLRYGANTWSWHPKLPELINPCGWVPGRTVKEHVWIWFVVLVMLYTSATVTFRLLLLRNLKGFMLFWQYWCSASLLFGFSFPCLGELISVNNHGNHSNADWKGPLKITYPKLPFKAGLSPTILSSISQYWKILRMKIE